MITRRSFLSALCALPFVAKLVPQGTTLAATTDVAATTIAVPAFTGTLRGGKTLAQIAAFQQAKSADMFAAIYTNRPFIAPTWAKVQEHYAEKYGPVNAFEHPRFRYDVEQLTPRS